MLHVGEDALHQVVYGDRGAEEDGHIRDFLERAVSSRAHDVVVNVKELESDKCIMSCATLNEIRFGNVSIRITKSVDSVVDQKRWQILALPQGLQI